MPSTANTSGAWWSGAWWRSAWWGVRVGLALALFAACSFWITFVAMPLGDVFSRRPRDLRGQWAVHWGMRVLRSAYEQLGLVRTRILGEERLRRPGPLLIVANHPTRVDMGPLLSARPQVDQIVNDQLASFPFLRGPIRAAEYVTNEASPAVVRECVRRLRAGRCLLIFPEGTRSPAGRLGPMKQGAARIALAAGVDLQPVTITCDPPILAKGVQWRDFPDHAVDLRFRVEDPIPIAPLLERGLSRREAARELTAELEELFLKRIAGGNA